METDKPDHIFLREEHGARIFAVVDDDDQEFVAVFPDDDEVWKDTLAEVRAHLQTYHVVGPPQRIMYINPQLLYYDHALAWFDGRLQTIVEQEVLEPIGEIDPSRPPRELDGLRRERCVLFTPELLARCQQFEDEREALILRHRDEEHAFMQLWTDWVESLPKLDTEALFPPTSR